MAEQLAVIPKRIGKYVLVERLGTGGMADVYLALQEGAGGFSKRVVIKRILRDHAADAAFVEMLLAEARLAAYLSHPNVVQIFDAGAEDGTYFVAMEYVPGPNLFQLNGYAQQRNQARLAPFVRLACGVAEGLDHAQRTLGPDGKPLEIVHRDLNPPNVLVNLDGLPKICDFGIARRARDVTTGGLLKGKCTYMAPEQIRGEVLDGRADLFALGVVLFETTTGRRLFKRDSDLQVFHAVLHEPIPRPTLLASDYPARLEELVMWCLERDRTRRCPDARTLQQALEEFLRGVDDPAASWLGLRDWVRKVVPAEVQTAFARPPSQEVQRPRSLASLVALTSTPPPGSPVVHAVSHPAQTPLPAPRPPTAALPVANPPPAQVLKVTGPTRAVKVEVPLAARSTGWMLRRAGAGVVAAGLLLLGLHAARGTSEAPHASPAPAVDPQADERAARAYVDAARRLLAEQSARPAEELLAKARALHPREVQTNIAIAELEAQLARASAPASTATATAAVQPAPAPAVPVRVDRERHAAPHPRKAELEVTGLAGLEVHVDGEAAGAIPIRRELDAGHHKVEILRPGFVTEVRELDLAAGQKSSLVAQVDAPVPKPAPVAPPAPPPVAKPSPAVAQLAPLVPEPVDYEPGVLFAPGMTRPERLSPQSAALREAATRLGAHGPVLARCDISRRGLVHDCELVRCPEGLERPALDALHALRMKPATLDGKPVALHGYTVTEALP